MAPPNPNHLGVILKASAKASPAVTLWCIAGAWGELLEEAIQNINPFDKANQAQVRAQIKGDHQGEVVWIVMDPDNLAHRRAVAYAFSQGKYGTTPPNVDFENMYSQDMALMAFYKCKRAVKYEHYVCKMRCLGREPRLSNYSILPRNDEIPSTMHGLGAGTYGDFLRKALRNFDYKDGANCRSANAIMLIWLARRRLYHWYSLQEAVEYSVLEDEAFFQPRRPFWSYFQMFGSAMGGEWE
ncbi:uncharacterized protein Bfra_000093 [Botrytis fragariae]|uniref:Uncharacterized protein n=1 Tax=Botrytis fragariae TaxID=1964551 RepID=A0A8H6B208_9HELO|nr:uncharacterized protein Bfra_000093 [Botrytis fragariae]KAF5877929.1 hypothetical protein Bfra_000093 [Botrytis fragariae]